MEENKNKSIIRNLVIILIIVAISVAGIIAYSRYRTTVTGSATAQSAKWSYNVRIGETQGTTQINLADTITNTEGTIAEGKIAPGTEGKFEIVADATGTETALTSTVEVIVTDKPTNLKFYVDEEKQHEIDVVNNKFMLEDYLAQDNMMQTETIYWDWPLETGEYEFEKEQNDEIDTQDQSKTMTMEIKVTGAQISKTPRYLVDEVQVGDYVAYDANSNGTYVYEQTDCPEDVTISENFSSANEFNCNAPAQWRVLSVDKESGTLQLISSGETIQTMTLTSGKQGYINSVDALNEISAIYGNGKGAIHARSMTLKDIEKYSSFEKRDYANLENYKYGDVQKYTSSSGMYLVEKPNGVIVQKSAPVEFAHTDYRYNAIDYFTTEVYNTIFKKQTDTDTEEYRRYWLASRTVDLYGLHLGYYVGRVLGGGVQPGAIASSVNATYTISNWGICPVVSLQSNIKTTGKDANGVWQLDI